MLLILTRRVNTQVGTTTPPDIAGRKTKQEKLPNDDYISRDSARSLARSKETERGRKGRRRRRRRREEEQRAESTGRKKEPASRASISPVSVCVKEAKEKRGRVWLGAGDGNGLAVSSYRCAVVDESVSAGPELKHRSAHSSSHSPVPLPLSFFPLRFSVWKGALVGTETLPLRCSPDVSSRRLLCVEWNAPARPSNDLTLFK